MAKMYKIPPIHVMDIMSTNPAIVRVDDDLDLLMNSFREYRFHGYPVLDKDNKVVGIARDLDILRMFARHYPGEIFHNEVGEIMLSPAATASPEDPVTEAMHKMLDSDTRLMPVVDKDDILLGVINQGDIVRAIEMLDRRDTGGENAGIEEGKTPRKRRKRTGKD